MRSSNNRLKKTDFKKIQQSAQQKAHKQVQALIQLIELPDYDVSEFFQTLLKNKKYEQMLEQIPRQKQVQFFARNYQSFLETQDQLLQLKLPILEQIPKAKQYFVKENKEEKEVQNSDQATVMEIIDSFSNHALQKNLQESVRIHQMIVEMRKHTRFQTYFQNFYISKLYRQYYNSFVQSCNDYKILLKIGQLLHSAKAYLKSRKQFILQQTKTSLNMHSSTSDIKKQMIFVINQIEADLKIFKSQFHQSLIKQPEIQVYVSKWISEVGSGFYQQTQSIIYEKEQLSDILQALGSMLQGSRQGQSRAVSLQRVIKSFIMADLPLHMQKVVEVVLEAFEDLLKDDNQLYEFIYFKSISTFSEQVGNLVPIKTEDYGKKCSTQKAILLVNSFIIILGHLCQQKWQFLLDNTLSSLLEKIETALYQTQLHQWDYYHLFNFLQKLSQGKVKHKKLYQNQASLAVKQKLKKAQKLYKQCWQSFESKATQVYYAQLLKQVPKLMWNWKKYAETKQKLVLQPSSFSIEIVVRLSSILKQLQFRLAKVQFELLCFLFYEYLVYVFQYILFFSYHKNGTNDSVFILKKKQEQFYLKAKQLPLEANETIKQNNILKLSNFTNQGLIKFGFQAYLITDIFKILSGINKLQCQQFMNRVCQILAKQAKIQPISIPRSMFSQSLNKFIQIYKEKPEMFNNYVNEKQKKLLSKMTM